jgi:3-hydroxyisobutyrate dehydrogenase-like beta-hydroxyacid dehydrogenase
MGGSMARNVMKRGHRLVVHDTQPAAVKALTDAGARAAATPKQVAAASEVVITMLPDVPDVERVALGEHGIVHGIARGSVYIDMSTIDPVATRKVGASIAARGAHMVDSPVGKTADAAVSGTLTLMVGGDPQVIARVRPVLDCMGSDFFHCGELGAGQTVKLINNLLATSIAEATFEALVTGTKAGLSLDIMTAVFKTTMAWSNQLAIAMPKRPLAGDFSPGFMMKLAHKDCRLALQMMEGLGVSAPVGRAALASLSEGLQRGLGDNDVGALLKLREEPVGVQVRLSRS